ncbi:MAG: Hsp20/alpha crystallin family protein [Nitrosopumilus sp.]
MATKKLAKKSSAVNPFLTSNWFDIDRSIENFRKEMEKAFSSFPEISMPKMPKSSCDVIDEGKQFRVKMNVPGIKKKEIKLDVTENSVDISAEHKEESEEKKKNYLKKERSQVSYFRTLPLSEKVVASKVKAKLTDGVLDITLPKTKPTKIQKKKSISVQ